MTAASGENPYVIGVTGHRDLPPAQVPVIRAAVLALLRRLLAAATGSRLQVLCSMADGADLIVAEAAQSLGIEVVALLAFPEDICRSDLLSDAARQVFDRVMRHASRRELPLPPGVSRESLGGGGPQRDQQYRRAAQLQARHCALLIAIWDRRPTTHMAGSARVVEFRAGEPMFEIRCTRLSTPGAVHDASGVKVLGFAGTGHDAGDPLTLPAGLLSHHARR